jgi:hypothetical protein
LVAKKAPERWRDTDEAAFFDHLASLVPRFKRVESIGFNGAAAGTEEFTRCIRLTVTRPDGSEADEILHWSPEDDHRLQHVEETLNTLIRDHGNVALAAAARLFLQQQIVTEENS